LTESLTIIFVSVSLRYTRNASTSIVSPFWSNINCDVRMSSTGPVITLDTIPDGCLNHIALRNGFTSNGGIKNLPAVYVESAKLPTPVVGNISIALPASAYCPIPLQQGRML